MKKSPFFVFFECLAICLGTFALAACSDNSASAEEFNAASICPESGRGSFVDDRDGKTYQYTTIGGQVWMAENLNYVVNGENLKNPLNGDIETASDKCFYPDDDCEVKGRAYKWLTAYNVCPDGWHLPSEHEWRELFKIVGGTDVAAYKLKSVSGWNSIDVEVDARGEDLCGFGLLPSKSSATQADGYVSSLWTSTLRSDGLAAYFVSVQSHSIEADIQEGAFFYLYVRCKKYLD